MKTNVQTSSFIKHLVQCLAISYSLQLCAMAQEENVVQVQPSQDKVVNVDNNTKPINVDGDAVEEEVTDSELQYLDGELNKQGKQIKLNAKKTQKYKKLQVTTEKLSDTTERYVEEKKASEKSIKEYNQKIKCLLDESGTDPECDSYRKEEAKVAPPVVAPAPVVDAASTQAAAPAQQPVIINNILPAQEDKDDSDTLPSSIDNSIEKAVDADKKEEITASQKMKIAPYLGVASFDGEGVSGIQSNTLMGIRFESKPYAGHFSMGAGLSYKQLTTRDNNPILYNGGGIAAPEVEYTNTAIDVYGKFILLKDSDFMPYALAGAGYNMMTVEYRNNDPYSIYSSTSAHRNYISGVLGAGLDYAFTPNIGAGLELNYATTLNNVDNGESQNNAAYYGKPSLQTLADHLSDANVFAVQAGLVVFF